MLYVFSELIVNNFRTVKAISEQTNAKIILVGCHTVNCKTKEKFRNLPNSDLFLERRGSKDCCRYRFYLNSDRKSLTFAIVLISYAKNYVWL